MYLTHKIKIQPNSHAKRSLTMFSHYSRDVCNRGLTIWNDQESAYFIEREETEKPVLNKYPTWQNVRNELVANKTDYDYSYPASIMKATIRQLGRAFENAKNPNMVNHKRPKFKSRKRAGLSVTFENDGKTRFIRDGKLKLPRLDYPIRLTEQPRFIGTIKQVTITNEADGWYASLMTEVAVNQIYHKTGQSIGIDMNIGHFDSKIGRVNTLPDSLKKSYSDIAFYQRKLAKMRKHNPKHFNSNNYRKTRAKLKRSYQRITRLQDDLLHKFTVGLVKQYDVIGVEDLDVNQMKMNKYLSKNIHRSMFGKFKQQIAYKAERYNKRVVFVDQFYPSTQTCSNCGYRKTNDSYGGKHGLDGDNIYHQHQTYRCYECGLVIDRDVNAYTNIENYAIAESAV